MIVLAGSAAILNRVLAVCQSRFGGAEIHVALARQIDVYGFRSRRDVAAIHAFEKAFTLRFLRGLRAIRKQRFDLALVTESPFASNQLIANAFARLAGPRELRLVSSLDGRTRRISIRKSLLDLLRFAASRKFGNYFLANLSHKFKGTRVIGLPYEYYVETSALCNLRCPGCPTGSRSLSRPQGIMPFASFRRVLDQCGPYARLMMLHLFGEPLLNKDLCRMIAYAKGRGVSWVELSTNGNFDMDRGFARRLLLSGLDYLVVSLDGTTQETYSVYRPPGDIARVRRFIRTLAKARQDLGRWKPIIDMLFIVMKHNEREIDEARKLAADLGADNLRLHRFNIEYCLEDARRWLPLADPYCLYQSSQGVLRTKAEFRETCRSPWNSLFVCWNGLAIPCCHDSDARCALGDVFASRVRTVWNGRKFRSFRRTVVTHRERIALCRECQAGWTPPPDDQPDRLPPAR